MGEVTLLYEYFWKLELIGLWLVRLNYMIHFQRDLDSFVRFFVLKDLNGKETAVENSHHNLCKLVRCELRKSFT